jgi:hypothetical protein
LVAVLAIYYLLPLLLLLLLFLASFLADSQPSKASLHSPLLTTHLKRKRATKSKNQKNYIGISSKQTTADSKVREEELLLLPLLSRMIHSQEGLVTYLTSAIDSRLGINIIVCTNQPGFNPNTKKSLQTTASSKTLDMYSTKSCCSCCDEEIASKEGNYGGGACMGMHRHSSCAPATTSPLFWERHREPISNAINSKQANGRDPC